ncbi:AAA family ATPase [Larkinella bovis]|uniref:AAA family ATPase n=1 Tax=Larkinella bovis TaxID=683041 RepID=A0ABW0IF61_9BACT
MNSSTEIIFYIRERSNQVSENDKNIIVLIHDLWDDWFTYSTLYNIFYFNHYGEKKRLGSIKIGQKGMGVSQRKPNLPEIFTSLSSDFFSLGQDVSYYEELNELGEDLRDNILSSLNDISFNQDIYISALEENVTKISLLRDVSQRSVEGQFRRLAQGNAVLTSYKFQFIVPSQSKSEIPNMVLDFNVEPKSNPPTNIHVIIGRNGVGKTHLFNNMILALLNENQKNTKSGYFSSDEDEKRLFANLVSVSFSAFDEMSPINEKRDKVNNINYSYIGLKRQSSGNKMLPPKSPTILKNEFVKSVEKCRLGSKNLRWLRALEMLEADPNFKEAEISKIALISIFEDFKDYSSNIFSKLSSGHKIILLTITRLVETVEERSLVILDEPEAYLHPPLLNAFIRALSDLLIQRNAVAIIGTHSPVVLQEVPKSCVWKLRRIGNNAIGERLDIESFGENVGLLTQEVFGLEVTDSGFHKILRKLADSNDTYQEAILELNNQLGLEGKSILRNLISTKK